ncbi:hypothetical protein K2F40_01685 [Clostridium sp. CM028]|uniref:hypothetical protein n=1 Tax=unclassified Clostridium TaxID=2614128 RepID=UPI001C0CB066|nr:MULTISPECIES: hypothetical protein [unclassified Clostridium]MBU3092950.1 hypothetical protein [Clostridium sp. CF011]MBW9143976.1 hypothetical protein [Clostridium sp. CM027]MBW9147708.1 hypothetical protein [Clostridium sp. CM028]UVE41364.1 hypothetical protein KTC92_02380 [Clostridium sp. CM027]WAG70375.1 hypothetical protein LL036_02750 [Clostridium sp. CF011]
MSIKKEFVKEQPYIPAGPFKIRIPGIHYKFQMADYIQGLLMCAVCLGAIPMLQEFLGMPFEVAMAVVVLNGIFYCAHVFLGDPVVPGWVTPAIPLLILYVSDYAIGPERIQALIAFEMSLGALALLLGATGLGKKIVHIVPNAMQSGIIIGAGIAAVNIIFVKGARFDQFPISIVVCVGLGFYLLFSNHFKSISNKNKILKAISNLGILPIIALAIIFAPLVGETAWPKVEWGITKPAFGVLWTQWTLFSKDIGFPPVKMFINALPMVISAYIVLFGDMIQSQALIGDCKKERPDELIDYNPNRSHIIFGLRNMLMSVIGPDLTMCGPLWAAMQVVICERYKHGKESMESIFGGAGSFRFGTLTGYLLLPIVSLCKPILGIALASTMLIQGYVSIRVGVLKARTANDLGIAGVMAAVVATRGAAWGLAAGIVLCIIIQSGNKPKFDVMLFENEELEA